MRVRRPQMETPFPLPWLYSVRGALKPPSVTGARLMIAVRTRNAAKARATSSEHHGGNLAPARKQALALLMRAILLSEEHFVRT